MFHFFMDTVKLPLHVRQDLELKVWNSRRLSTKSIQLTKLLQKEQKYGILSRSEKMECVNVEKKTSHTADFLENSKGGGKTNEKRLDSY